MPNQQTTTKAFAQNDDLNKENRDFSPEYNPDDTPGEASTRKADQDFNNIQSTDAAQAGDNGNHNQPQQKPAKQAATDADEAQSDGSLSFPAGK